MKFRDNQWTQPEIASFSSAEFKDCFPAFSYDGGKLYFVLRRPVESGGESGPYNIWIADRTSSGWSKPEPMDPPVNSEHYDGGPSFSKDGTLYFFSNREGGKGSFDIYCSKFVDGRFIEPENLGDKINTESMDLYAFIAPDEGCLIFASNRPGGFGSVDLYIAFRRQDGSWTKAKNMGDKINSKDGENFPWISPDGEYFFFGSDRNGNNDVYWMDAGIIDALRK
jgi:Tol biopolymer transport system component